MARILQRSPEHICKLHLCFCSTVKYSNPGCLQLTHRNPTLSYIVTNSLATFLGYLANTWVRLIALLPLILSWKSSNNKGNLETADILVCTAVGCHNTQRSYTYQEQLHFCCQLMAILLLCITNLMHGNCSTLSLFSISFSFDSNIQEILNLYNGNITVSNEDIKTECSTWEQGHNCVQARKSIK